MRLMKRMLATLTVCGLATAVAFAIEAKPRPWIGVTLSPVPGAVAKHVGLDEGTGIMISNVAEESPAADAGLEQYDVIVSLNGDPVNGDFAEFADRIADVGVGNVATLGVIRAGAQTDVAVALGEMPKQQDQIRYAYRTMPDVVTQVDHGVFGKVIEQDDQGKWIVKDLGQLDQLDDMNGLFDQLNNSMGQLDGQLFTQPNALGQMRFNLLNNNNGQREINITQSENGKSISIEVNADGVITVTRRDDNDANAVETVETYDNEEALQAADEEAYELYKQVDRNGGGAFAFGFPNVNVQMQDDAQVREAMERARQAMQQALGQAGGLQQSQAVPDLKQFQQSTQNGYNSWPQAFALRTAGKATTTFDQKPDGSIVVKIHKGEHLLTQEYASEADFEQNDPDLYAKYRALLDAAEK